jgi:hypothetical protein
VIGPDSQSEVLDEWSGAEAACARIRDRIPGFQSSAAELAELRRRETELPLARPWGIDLPNPPESPPESSWECLRRQFLRWLFQPPYHSGEEILEADTKRRIRTLMAIEAALPADCDYAALIGPACVVLELELARLLKAPTFLLGSHLADVLDQVGRSNQAELLRKWQNGELPPTMGLLAIVLTALEKAVDLSPNGIPNRCGVDTDSPALKEAVELPWHEILLGSFTPAYLGLLRSGKLSLLLDRVRKEYRNPACHGLRTFDRREYTALVWLLLARGRFRSWFRRGPATLETGLLDLHLLEQWRQDRAAREWRPRQPETDPAPSS